MRETRECPLPLEADLRRKTAERRVCPNCGLPVSTKPRRSPDWARASGLRKSRRSQIRSRYVAEREELAVSRLAVGYQCHRIATIRSSPNACTLAVPMCVILLGRRPHAGCLFRIECATRSRMKPVVPKRSWYYSGKIRIEWRVWRTFLIGKIFKFPSTIAMSNGLIKIRC